MFGLNLNLIRFGHAPNYIILKNKSNSVVTKLNEKYSLDYVPTPAKIVVTSLPLRLRPRPPRKIARCGNRSWERLLTRLHQHKRETGQGPTWKLRVLRIDPANGCNYTNWATHLYKMAALCRQGVLLVRNHTLARARGMTVTDPCFSMRQNIENNVYVFPFFVRTGKGDGEQLMGGDRACPNSKLRFVERSYVGSCQRPASNIKQGSSHINDQSSNRIIPL